MEKLTKKLIGRLPLDVVEITLSVDDSIPYSFSTVEGRPTKCLPGIRYSWKAGNGSYTDRTFDGICLCRPRFFMSGIRRAHIVASELKGYVESFGAEVHYNGQK